MLKKTLLMSAAAAVVGSHAMAGGFAPVVDVPEPVVVVEPEPARSSLGLILPLVLLGGLVALAVASENDDNNDGDTGNGSTTDDGTS